MRLGGCPSRCYGHDVGRKRIGFAVPIRSLGHMRVRFMVEKEIPSCHTPVRHLGESSASSLNMRA